MILNWFNKIKARWQGLTPRRKNGVIFLVCLLSLGGIYLFASADSALAQGVKNAADFVKDPATYTANGLVNFATKVMMWLATFFMRLAIFFMKFLLEVAGYNGYLDSTAVTVGWVMVRDISNMFFVVILLLIAFGTILGIEQYEWKKLLVKFVFAAILVNFSRVIAALIIDAAQVVMVTFLNGVAATAGGNLINAFKLDKLLSFNPNLKAEDLDNTQVFLAGFAAVWFSAMTAAVMAGYVMLMAARLVMLWILIVLSPLAFLMNVLPQTQKYASQWWTEFGNHVVVGPILAFFLWLSFVTVGSGTIHDEISQNNNYAVTEEAATADTNVSVGQQTASGVSEIMKWTSMAGFFIALGMLFAGIKITMSLNTIGGAMFGKAVEYGKKAAMIGSGAAAGIWLGRKGLEGGAAAAKWTGGAALRYLTPYEEVKRWGQRQVAGFHAWRKDTGYRPKIKRDQNGNMLKDEKGRVIYERDEEGNLIMEATKRGRAQRVFNWRARKEAASKKKLEKTENFAKVRDELLLKRTGGVPTYLLQGTDENADALDRMEQGMLAKEKDRSAAKTKEYNALGAKAVAKYGRFKDGKWDEGGETLTEQIAKHEIRGSLSDASLESGKARAMEEISKKLAQGDKERGDVNIFKQIAAHKMSTEAAKAEYSKLESEGKREYVREGKALSPNIAMGEELIQKLNDAEIGKKAAEDFVKGIKDAKLTKAFDNAKDQLEEIMKNAKMDPEATAQALTAAARSQPYLDALKQGEILAKSSREKGIREKQAADAAHDAVIGLAQGGRTQSSALSEQMEKYKKEYDVMERTQAQKLAADRISHLMRKMEKQGGKLELDDELALNAAISAVDAEAWNDDVIDHVFDMIGALDKGELTEPTEIEKAKGFKDLTGKLGWGYEKDKDGKKKIKTPYNRKMSAQLQNLASFGGNVEAVQAADKTEKTMEEDLAKRQERAAEGVRKRENLIKWNERKAAEGQYEQTAQQALGEDFDTVNEMVNTGAAPDLRSAVASFGPQYVDKINRVIKDRMEKAFDSAMSSAVSGVAPMSYEQSAKKSLGDAGAAKYMDQLSKAQDYLQNAARTYTRDAYGNKHYESSHNQQYDTKLKGGMLRPMTEREAKRETIVDMAKMKLNDLSGAQIHSIMQMDLNSHLPQKIDEEMYRAVFAQMKEEYQWSSVNSRTAAKAYGYDVGENPNKNAKGYAIIGSKQMDKTFGSGQAGTQDRGLHVIKDLLLPQLLGQHKAFFFGLKSMFNHISLNEANKGTLKVDIDGFGEIKDLGHLLETIKTNKMLSDNISKSQIERLSKIVKDASSANGLGLGRGTAPNEARAAA